MRLLVVEPQCPVWAAFFLPGFSVVVLTVVLGFLFVCVPGHSREDPGRRRLLDFVLPPVRSLPILGM